MNELLGTDIALSFDRDIAVLVRDFATVSGVENVVRAFVRALLTPYGYLARFIYDTEGIKVVDEDYGNVAFHMLSEPLTLAWINTNIEGIYQVADNEPRVQLIGVDYELFDLTRNRVRFHIRFSVLDDPREFNLVLFRDGATLTGGLVAG